MKRPQALMRFVRAHRARFSNETFRAACSVRPTPRAAKHATFHSVPVLVRPVTIARMASLEEVSRLASAMPGVTEGHRYGHRSWFVAGKSFLWERPFSKADIKQFGDTTPPEGPIIAVAVDDLGEKEAVLAEQRGGFFTISHFDGCPAVLIQLGVVLKRPLREAIVDGWLACAPQALGEEYLRAAQKRDQ